jgi:hypothetical protein
MLQQLDSANWSENGLNYGKNPELYALPLSVTDSIERMLGERG